jgi:preprotein translocase subunit SecA
MAQFLRKLFDSNERDLARYKSVVAKINALEPQYEKMSNAELRAKTDEFRAYVQSEWQKKLEQMEREGVLESERKNRTRKLLDQVLDSILPDAFALVREAAKRTLGQRHYDVQLIGGMVTHDGRIAELKTGEGKTLMATLPLFLNALAGRGAHLVTANDYLSKVGAVWMGPIYHLLGMTVGIIQGQSPETGDLGGSYQYDPDYIDPDPRYTYCRPITRREAYYCDITYGTNNEFGFDYLRDNMTMVAEELSMRDLHFAIVDEVDSILIDEARTPLIISGMIQQDTSLYYAVDRVVRTMRAGKEPKTQQEKDDPNSDRNNPNIHYLVDEKQKTVSLTDAGVAKAEAMLGIPNLSEDPRMMHYIIASMKAHALFKKDVEYIVKDGEIIIVDEFTGRLMFGRRYSDGLHQAIEAKEGVQIKNESQTLATITFQNLFRIYLKLAGMTGTAKTEEDEFRKIYGLDVVVVPTNKPMIRKDHPDVIYKVAEHKYRGITQEILRLYTKQQPVLVGTRSIEISELVSERLTMDRLQVLAMISLIRPVLEASKLDKAKKEKYSQILNTPLDIRSQKTPPEEEEERGKRAIQEPLTLHRLQPIARELGLNPDPLHEENMRKLIEMMGLAVTDEALDHLQEALEHGIPHNVLNAKFHEKEAIIIAEAGRKGAVTIATNMAGRGVDILLGGKPEDMELPPGQDDTLHPADAAKTGEGEGSAEANAEEERIRSFRRGGRKGTVLESVVTLTPEEHRKAADEVRALGGLFILGTERHESRRIDNQLRGRAGRQGDPGESRFYVSLEDELWRLFGDRSQHPLLRGWPEDQAMDVKIFSRLIERAQKKVEEYHFEARKNVLNYDDVMNKQRDLIYSQRRRILEGMDLRETIISFLRQTVTDAVAMFCPADNPPEWDLDGLYRGLDQYFPLHKYAALEELQGKSYAELESFLSETIERAYCDREAEVAAVAGDMEAMRELERRVALDVINRKWTEHLANIDYLRENIGLQGYAQKDPLLMYQKEAFNMFEEMQHSIQDEIARFMFHFQLVNEPPPPRRQYAEWSDASAPDATGEARASGGASARKGAGSRKPGRNDPCWCGSGKKYKQCHYPN